jgi:GNAT superfamily N-acetyltransferase
MGERPVAAASVRYRIRPALEQDVPGVVACLRDAFEPYRDEYTPAAYLDTVTSARIARERLRSMTVLVAEDSAGAIVGTLSFARVSDEEGHLRGMAVRQSWWGSGVAGALLQNGIARLRSEGCRRATLDTTLPLRRAMRFYERNGFRRSGKLTDFFGMPLIEYGRELA